MTKAPGRTGGYGDPVRAHVDQAALDPQRTEKTHLDLTRAALRAQAGGQGDRRAVSSGAIGDLAVPDAAFLRFEGEFQYRRRAGSTAAPRIFPQPTETRSCSLLTYRSVVRKHR